MGLAGMVMNKDDGSGEAQHFAESVGIPVLSAIPADDDIRRKSANYEIVGIPGGQWAGLFEELATGVAEAPPLLPTPLEHEGLLGLFDSDGEGGSPELVPATAADMCGKEYVERPSLEVVYDDA